MQKINLIALGTDPEFFIRDVKNEVFISGEGLIGGTKEEPLNITSEGHAIQEDNVMAEICVPPARDPEKMYNDIQFVIDYLNNKLEVVNPNYMIQIAASADFTKEQLATEQAQTVGCDPDYNAWFGMMNIAPELPETVRFAGGHVHISYENPSEETNFSFVKVLDLFLGVPSVLMDIDDRRKEIYGTPGRFRHKSYGVEYRSLSNYWTESLEKIQWVFKQVEAAIEFYNSGKEVPELVPVTIDTNNKENAKEICKEFNIEVLYSQILQEQHV